MKIATAKSRTSKAWKTGEWYWDQFLDRLREPTRTGETMEQYRAMTKDLQTEVKDVGGFVGGALSSGERRKENVIDRCMITLDADHAQRGDVDVFRLLNPKTRFAVYSTHSHTPEHPRLRWIFPLSRAVTPEEYPAVARMMAKRMGIEAMDPKTYEIHRLMFWPSVCADGEYVFVEQEGREIDPDELLSEYGGDEAWRDAALWPVSSLETEAAHRESGKLLTDPRTKNGVLGAFCRVYGVEDAIEAFDLPYVKCEGAYGREPRYTYTHGSTAGGAVVYDDGQTLYSNHATDPAGGHGCNAFDLVRIHRFRDLDEESQASDVTRLPSYKAMCELAGADPRVRAEQIRTQREGVSADFSDMGRRNDRVEGEDGAVEDDPNEWMSLLRYDKKGVPETTLSNAKITLLNLPELKGKLKYYLLLGNVYVDGETPWPRPDNKLEEVKVAFDPSEVEVYTGPPAMVGRPWDAIDKLYLYEKMEHDWGYKMNQKNNGLIDNALYLASMNQICDPLSDYLNGLEWDGTERLDTVFIRWLGAEDNELNRAVTRLWFMGAVDRALRPGCKFDSVLVLCGEQGIGKTKMLSMLAGGDNAYFTNSLGKVEPGKATSELLLGKWIVEFGEIDSIKRSDITSFKDFVSRQSDSYREPYERQATDHARRCVFAGTSNELSFLRDETGERRFWVVQCEGNQEEIRMGKKGWLIGFEYEIGQIWAEAKARWEERLDRFWKPGQRKMDANLELVLADPQLKAEMEKRQQGYKLVDEDRDVLLDYLDTPKPRNWNAMTLGSRRGWLKGQTLPDEEVEEADWMQDSVTLLEIEAEVFGKDVDDHDRGGRPGVTANRIVGIMNALPDWARDDERERWEVYGKQRRTKKWRKKF